jgi:hypothetical protein
MTATTIEYALMAGAAYYDTRDDNNRTPFPDATGWGKLPGFNHTADPATGFEAVAFTRGTGATQDIVISYAGTYDAVDKAADANLGLGGLDNGL